MNRKIYFLFIFIFIMFALSYADEITLPAHNPLIDMETNSQLTYQFRKILNHSTKTENRLFNAFLFYYEDQMLEKISHEYSHYREGNRYGEYQNSFYLFRRLGVQKWQYDPTEKQLLKIACAGLNQNEFNAYKIFDKNSEELSFEDALHYLVAKFYDFDYALFSSFDFRKEVCDKKYWNWHYRNERGAYVSFRGDDLGIYVNLQKASIGKLTSNIAIADLGSAYTYDSINCVGKYLFNKGDKVRVSQSPFISHYLTENGSFFDVRYKKHNLEYDFGWGGGRKCRFGFKTEHKEKINYSLYLSQGCSLGLSYENKNYFAKIEYNNHDLLENEIKGKPRGIYINGGLNIRW